MTEDEATIRAFFDELDRRIKGTSGMHTLDSRLRMAKLRPVLLKRAREEPGDFVRRLRCGASLLR